ncbi:MAG: UbiA family prenyltransferase [Planctomycetota bacterium]
MRLRQLVEITKIARPGFWPTHIWFYVLPFAQIEMFGRPEFWVGVVYVCFPLSLLLYGWNDMGDWETDRNNPRKDSWLFGAKPSESIRNQLPSVITFVQLPFIAYFWWHAGTKMLLLILGILLTNYTYNNLGFKKIALLDLLNQAGYLLIFIFASWLCDVPQLNFAAMVFGAIFAMQSHLFGQLMDIDQDRSAGRKSTAIQLGVTRSKILLASMMTAEAAIAFCNFTGGYVGWYFIAGSVFFAVDALLGPKRYPLWFLSAFFVGWNIIVISTIHFIWRDGIFMLATEQ